MNLCSINLARSVWLVRLKDLNPRGKYILDVIPAIGERYSFAQAPTLTEVVSQSEGAEFKNGAFRNSNGETVEVSLTIHDDGFIANTRSSTRDCDDFLGELFDWLCSAYGIEERATLEIRKIYVSELYFAMPGSLSMIHPVLAPYLQSVSSQVLGHEEVAFEVNGITFGPDPGEHSKPVSFRIERADNVPFSQNRYYSLGPFQTETHIELLQELETLMTT